ncbi:MAG: lysostaphin resistance A-like protein [Bacteroidales bacterium]
MENTKSNIYPTVSQAIMLLVIALLIEVAVNLPLSIYDYFKGTDYLFNRYKSFVLIILVNSFILIYGVVRSRDSLRNIFPYKSFSLWVLPLVLLTIISMQRFITYVNGFVISHIPVPPWFAELFNHVLESEFGFIGQVGHIVIFAAIVEEFIFRGVIMRGLLRKYSPFFAILVSAFLFAAYHLNPWQFSVALYLGLFLGWLRYKTRNIWLPIIAHALNNFIVLIGSSPYRPGWAVSASSFLENISDLQYSIVLLLSVILLVFILHKYPKTQEDS